MMMLQDLWNTTTTTTTNNNNQLPLPAVTRLSSSAPCSPVKPIVRTQSEPFHVAHKVPVGDTPYVKAKKVQLVDKDPDKAIALFWAAINAGDRVDSALKDMAIVMKQQNRADEAIEAIKSLRNRCSDHAQESLDNILLDLYKRCGRLDDQIGLLRHKLLLIQQGLAFNGKRTKTARSQGRKFQVSLEQEATRLLGNLGWALMQKENYVEAEVAYRRALLIGPDNNKMCNLGICLMKQGKVAEAKDALRKVRPAVADGPRGVDSHLKAFERAQEMLRDLQSKALTTAGQKSCWSSSSSNGFEPNLTVTQSSSMWQPQPCVDLVSSSLTRQDQIFGDENVDLNRVRNGGSIIGGKNTAEAPPPPLSSSSSSSSCSSMVGNSLRIDAPPYYSRLSSNIKGTTAQVAVMNSHHHQQQEVNDPLFGNLKRSRPSGAGAIVEEKRSLVVISKQLQQQQQSLLEQKKSRRRSLDTPPIGSPAARWKDLLPDNKAFDEAIVAAALAPVLEAAAAGTAAEVGGKNDEEWRSPLADRKRLRVFEDITQSLSPRASATFFLNDGES